MNSLTPVEFENHIPDESTPHGEASAQSSFSEASRVVAVPPKFGGDSQASAQNHPQVENLEVDTQTRTEEGSTVVNLDSLFTVEMPKPHSAGTWKSVQKAAN